MIPEAQKQGITGLLEMIVEGKGSLMAWHQAELLPPTYVTGIDVGRKDTKIMKKTRYYIVVDTLVCPVTSNKESNTSCFGQQSTQVVDYVKENKLKFTRRPDLIKIVQFYNTIKE